MEQFNRRKAVTMLFAFYGQERATDRLEAYLIAFSDLSDNELQYALREASEARIGDPAFLPTAPQIVLAAKKAPPPAVQYERLNGLPPVYEMLPGNRKRVTREAIEFYGLEKVSEWAGMEITPLVLADVSNNNLLISPPRSGQLTRIGQGSDSMISTKPNGTVEG